MRGDANGGSIPWRVAVVPPPNTVTTHSPPPHGAAAEVVDWSPSYSSIASLASPDAISPRRDTARRGRCDRGEQAERSGVSVSSRLPPREAHVSTHNPPAETSSGLPRCHPNAGAGCVSRSESSSPPSSSSSSSQRDAALVELWARETRGGVAAAQGFLFA